MPDVNEILKSIKAKDVVRGMFESYAPFTMTTASSINESAKDVTRIGKQIKTGMRQNLKNIDQSQPGRKAIALFSAAQDALKNGTYELDEVNDAMYDDYEDYESNFSTDSMTEEERENTSPEEVILRGNRGVAQSVIRASTAQLQGMGKISGRMLSGTLRGMEASTKSINATILYGTNMLATQIGSVSSKLDTINANLVNLIEYQNNNTTQYYEKNLEVMNQMLASMANFDKMTHGSNARDLKNFNSRNGINIKDYFARVKKGIKGSTILTGAGTLGSMAKMSYDNPEIMSMGQMVGSFIPTILDFFGVGNKINKLQHIDSTLSKYGEELLYKIGDKLGSNMIASFLGLDSLGNKRQSVGSIMTGMYMKDQLPWNGKAQKALTEVIPELLTSIDAGINNNDKRYFDYDRGDWRSRKELERALTDDVNNLIVLGMNNAVEKLNHRLNNSGLTEDEIKKIKKQISDTSTDLVYDQYNRPKNYQKLESILEEAGLSMHEVSGAMNSLISSTNEITEQIADLYAQIGSTDSIYRNISNRSGENSKTAIGKKYELNLKNRENYNNIFSMSFNRDAQMTVDFINRQILEVYPEFKMTKEIKEGILLDIHLGYSDDEILRHVKNTVGKGALTDKIHTAAQKAWAKIRHKEYTPSINAPEDLSYTSYGQHLDELNIRALEKVYGIKTGFTSNNPKSKTPKPGAASSRATKESGKAVGAGTVGKSSEYNYNNYEPAIYSDIDNGLGAVINDLTAYSELPYDTVMEYGKSELDRIEKTNTSAADALNDVAKNKSSSLGGSIKNLVDAAVLSMGSMVSSFTSFGSRLFGKEGMIKSFFESESFKNTVTKIKNWILYDDEGKLKEPFQKAKDFGNKIWEDTKSTLTKYYDYAYDSYSKYKYGENYKDNEKWQNSSFMQTFNLNGKRIAKRDKTAKELGLIADKSHDGVYIDKDGNTYTYYNGTFRDKDGKKVTINSKVSNESKENNIISVGKSSTEALPNNNVEEIKESVEKISNDTLQILKSSVEQITETSVEVSEKLKSSTEAFTETIVGDETPDQMKKTFADSYNKTIKKALPKIGAGAILGAGLGFLNGVGGHSLLGSLFLPTGLFGGAIVGGGLSILSQTEAFKSVVFGKMGEDGERSGGLISKELKEKFKKAAPTMVGGAVAGALKSIITAPIGGGKGLGILGMQLLPGGILGGAITGMGIGLLKNSEKFKSMIFGKKGEDGKRTGTWLSKSFNDIKEKMSGEHPGLKNMLKGAGIGVVTGAVMQNMGIIPAALSAGGPIGMGIAGLGMGIAASTKHFNSWLFGTEEFDENGKSLGRKGGVLEQVKNILHINVIEPITFAFKSAMYDMVDWAKEKITFPFRKAFGPILDSIMGIKDNVTEFVSEKFEIIGDGIKTMLEKTIHTLFSPITNLIGKIGTAIIGGAKVGIQAAFLPLTAGLQALSVLTMGKRKDEYKKFYKNWRTSGGMKEALEGYWEAKNKDYQAEADAYNNDPKNKNKLKKNAKKVGFFEKASDYLSTIVGHGDVADAARKGWDDNMTEEGYNHLDHRGVGAEAAKLKADKNDRHKAEKQWNDIHKLIRKVGFKDLKGRRTELRDDRFKYYKDKFIEKGIDGSLLQTNDDLMQLLFDTENFRKRAAGDGERDGILQALKEYRLPPEELEAMNRTKEFQDNTTKYLRTISDDFALLSEYALFDRSMASYNEERKHDMNKLKKRAKRAYKSELWGDTTKINFNDPELAGYNIKDISETSLQDYALSDYAKSGDFKGWLKASGRKMTADEYRQHFHDPNEHYKEYLAKKNPYVDSEPKKYNQTSTTSDGKSSEYSLTALPKGMTASKYDAYSRGSTGSSIVDGTYQLQEYYDAPLMVSKPKEPWHGITYDSTNFDYIKYNSHTGKRIRITSSDGKKYDYEAKLNQYDYSDDLIRYGIDEGSEYNTGIGKSFDQTMSDNSGQSYQDIYDTKASTNELFKNLTAINEQMANSIQEQTDITKAQAEINAGGSKNFFKLRKKARKGQIDAKTANKQGFSGFFGNLFNRKKKDEEDAAVELKEAQESAEAQALGDETEETTKDVEDKNSETKETKTSIGTKIGSGLGTIFHGGASVIGGLFSGIGGLLGSFFNSKAGTVIKKFGAIAIPTTLGMTVLELIKPGTADNIGAKLETFNNSIEDGSLMDRIEDKVFGIFDFIKEKFNLFLSDTKVGQAMATVGNTIADHVPEIINSVILKLPEKLGDTAQFIAKHADTLIRTMTDVTMTIAPPLITAIIKELPRLAINLGVVLPVKVVASTFKALVNTVCSAIGLPKPFKDENDDGEGDLSASIVQEKTEASGKRYQVDKSAEKTYLSEEEASKVEASGGVIRKDSNGIYEEKYIIPENNVVGYDDEGNAIVQTDSGKFGTFLRTAANVASGLATGGNAVTKVGGALVKVAPKLVKPAQAVVSIAGTVAKGIGTGISAIPGVGKIVGGDMKGTGALLKTAAHPVQTAANLVAKVTANNADDVAVAASGVATKLLAKFAKHLSAIKNSPVLLKILEKFKSIFTAKCKPLEWICKFFDDIIKAIGAKCTGKFGTWITNKLSAGLAKVGGSTAFVVVTTTYGIVSGAMEAERLFHVDKADGWMTAISALMKGLLSLSVGCIIDVIFEIATTVMGRDLKSELAIGLYKLITSDDKYEELLNSQETQNAEREVYNAINGTNLDENAYNNLDNKTLFGKLGDTFVRGWNNLTGQSDKNTPTTEESSDIAKVLLDAGYSSDDISSMSRDEIMSVYNNRKSVGNGTGASLTTDKSVGYGPGESQANAAWANMPIGRFANGEVSTMRTGGCGPTALSTIANMYGPGITPATVGAYAANNGYISSGGANADLFTKGAAGLGLNGTKVGKSDIVSSLEAGKPMAISGKNSGPFTKNGHVIVANGISGNKISIIDPSDGRTKLYNKSDITSGMTNAWAYDKSSVGNGSGPIGFALDSANHINNDTELVSVAEQIPSSINELYYDRQGNLVHIPIDIRGNPIVDNPNDYTKYSPTYNKDVSLTTKVAKFKTVTKNVTDKVEYMAQQKASAESNTNTNTDTSETSSVVLSEDSTESKDYIASLKSALSKPITSIGDFLSGFSKMGNVLKAVLGTFKGEGSFTELYNQYASESETDTDSEDTNDNATNSNTNVSLITGVGSWYDPDKDDPEEKKAIWKYFRRAGFNEKAIAGIMGTWQAESRNRSGVYEGYYLNAAKKLGTENIFASHESLDNYVKNVIFPNTKGYSESGYIADDGHYYPGLGLAQWTRGRTAKLLKFANERGVDWRDLNTQLDFAYDEMINSYNLRNKLNNAKTIEDATEIVAKKYEGNTRQLAYQKDAANNYYNQYQGTVGYGKGPVGYASDWSDFMSGSDTAIKYLEARLEQMGLKNYLLGTSTSTTDSDESEDSVVSFSSSTNSNNGYIGPVNAMQSILGKLHYSLGSVQDPDQGVASCASTVAWAYNKALGIRPGDTVSNSAYASSTAQSKDSRFKTIWTNDGTGLTDEDINNLKPGDILYQNWNQTKNNGQMAHTEMYVGGNKTLSHGGPSYNDLGPSYKTLNSYRKAHTMMVRRLKDGVVGYGEGEDDKKLKLENNFTREMNKSMPKFKPNPDGEGDRDSYDFNDQNIVDRLDKIVSVIGEWYMMSKQSKPDSSSNSVTNNTVVNNNTVNNSTQKATAEKKQVNSNINKLMQKQQAFSKMYKS